MTSQPRRPVPDESTVDPDPTTPPRDVEKPPADQFGRRYDGIYRDQFGREGRQW